MICAVDVHYRWAERVWGGGRRLREVYPGGRPCLLVLEGAHKPWWDVVKPDKFERKYVWKWTGDPPEGEEFYFRAEG